MKTTKGNVLQQVLKCGIWGVAMCGLALVLGCNVSGPSSGGISTTYNFTTHTLKILPVFDPSGSDVANFDASSALLNLAMTNAVITTTSGTLTVTVTNPSTGAVLGQGSFGYVVKGSALYAQDPTAVHNWLQQFANDPSVTVSVATDNVAEQDTGASGTASVTSSAEYEGTTYATAYKAWPVGSSGTGCGTGRVKCVQQ